MKVKVWYGKTSGGQTQAVAKNPSNLWRLFDMSGKRIKNIAEEKRNRGIYNYEIDLADLNGLYFVNALINGKEYSNKIMVF